MGAGKRNRELVLYSADYRKQLEVAWSLVAKYLQDRGHQIDSLDRSPKFWDRLLTGFVRHSYESSAAPLGSVISAVLSTQKRFGFNKLALKQT